MVIKVLENLEEDFPDIEEEYKILKNLSRHPNLAEFVGAFMHTSKENKEQLWLVSQVLGLFSLIHFKKEMIILLDTTYRSVILALFGRIGC